MKIREYVDAEEVEAAPETDKTEKSKAHGQGEKARAKAKAVDPAAKAEREVKEFLSTLSTAINGKNRFIFAHQQNPEEME